MAEEDWDLYAVVRSCKSAVHTATPAVIANNSSSNGKNSSRPEDSLASLGSLTFKEQCDPFTFPNLNQNGSLQDSHDPFLPQAYPTPTIVTNRGIDLSSSFMSVNGGYSGQHHQHQMLQQKEFQRSRKRKKSEQKRTVCHVTGDNLSSDPWAWRKYGQKPIKGSPYPRNYYRCSSSKGCSARKQVERSNSDPNIFIVTYTSDHTHPRPTHRSSLAGCTRNKLSTIQKAATNVHKTADNGFDKKGDDNDLLIDDVHVEEDLFKGLEELVRGTGGGSSTSSGLGSSWPAFGDNWGRGNDNSASGAAASSGC